MKRTIAVALAALLVAVLGATAVFAGGEQIPSAQSAFASNNVYAMTVGKAQSETGWFDILSSQIKTGDPKDIVVDVSAETFLGTSAKLSGTDGSDALAEIQVRVLVDGQEAVPGPVTFDNRMLKLEGDLTHHYEGALLPIDDHWIEIFIDTAAAHAFNFAYEDLGSGVHTIVVQANLKTVTGGLKGTADAAIGKISVVVDEVMFKRVQ